MTEWEFVIKLFWFEMKILVIVSNSISKSQQNKGKQTKLIEHTDLLLSEDLRVRES